jgi:hypothetical protein
MERMKDRSIGSTISAGLRKHYQEHPEAKLAKSKMFSKNFNDPIIRAKHKEAINRPEFREAKSKSKQALWDDPEWRNKQIAIQNNPETTRRHSAAMKLKWADAEWRARQEALYASLDYAGRFSGANNPKWQGGIGRKPYGPGFTKSLRNKIRTRDDDQCQLCGQLQNGKRLDVHHINYNKNDNRPENLISLCAKCHTDTGQYRDSWETFFATNPQNIAY